MRLSYDLLLTLFYLFTTKKRKKIIRRPLEPILAQVALAT